MFCRQFDISKGPGIPTLVRDNKITEIADACPGQINLGAITQRFGVGVMVSLVVPLLHCRKRCSASKFVGNLGKDGVRFSWLHVFVINEYRINSRMSFSCEGFQLLMSLLR